MCMCVCVFVCEIPVFYNLSNSYHIVAENIAFSSKTEFFYSFAG